MRIAKNVLGTELQGCCTDPMTGFYRNGRCDTSGGDFGLHIVCARMTEEFLTFSRHRGNDFSTPAPENGFPGLRPGDHLCVERWKEARVGCVPDAPYVASRTRPESLMTQTWIDPK